MTAITTAPPTPSPLVLRRPAARSIVAPLATLTRRRFALSAHTPREIVVPLMTPILFSVVIAPALAKVTGAIHGIDYMSFVAIGTVGLLVPLNCMFAGIGVIVDRQSGARRDLLAAPVPRSLIVFGNLAVALSISAFQVVALFVAAVLRGAQFDARPTGVVFFAAAAVLLAVAMYGGAEILANRISKQEEYIGAVPAIAIVPWFFAGSLFPISALPTFLGAFAKVLPLTHALAVMRYGLLDGRATGLHDIWGMTNATAMAALSLLVVAAYAALLLSLSVRVFSRAAVK
ncbi:MAG TPA: ABC transporter permease [Acidimicrobiales bacterium]|jgi:ABC-type polysaccharide/polyol phosphate export permease|nr:ABC transporter permease [Acidimicrobiales bacterium]